jgi:hypothetical protein
MPKTRSYQDALEAVGTSVAFDADDITTVVENELRTLVAAAGSSDDVSYQRIHPHRPLRPPNRTAHRYEKYVHRDTPLGSRAAHLKNLACCVRNTVSHLHNSTVCRYRVTIEKGHARVSVYADGAM